MSEKSVFEIRITGKPGHGAMPHKCIDPIPAVGSLICSMQTIVSRNIDPFLPVICTINSVTAGVSDNSAPESALLTGYIRSFDHDAHMRMIQRLTGLAEGTAAAYECRCDVRITPMVPAVDNSEEMYRLAYRAAECALGPEHVTDSEPCLASEDFAVYGTEIPSFLYWVGSGTRGRENAPWHDPAFCVDAHYTEYAIPVLCASVIA
jgi:amidohydrolase